MILKADNSPPNTMQCFHDKDNIRFPKASDFMLERCKVAGTKNNTYQVAPFEISSAILDSRSEVLTSQDETEIGPGR